MQQIRTGDALSAVTAPARFVTVLMGGFAGIAVLLTATGLYGVLSYMVAKRRREIGVRIALGARRTEVVHLVARRAARLVAGGLITGSIGAFAAEHVVSVRLISVQASAPVLVLGACVVLLVTSSIAALVPALRAASGDPMLALRSE
jgi:ABC-type antimicrobial peptide transport system permease subunit